MIAKTFVFGCLLCTLSHSLPSFLYWIFMSEIRILPLNNLPLGNLLRAAINPPLLELPLYMGKVSAGRTTGFASPAQDYEQECLDLNKKLVSNIPATFFYTVGKSDDSMIDDGILPGALMIVNRALMPKSGRNVVVVLNGEILVKRLYSRAGVVELRSMNKAMSYPNIRLKEGQELIIEGVVTHAVNSY